MSTSSRIVIPSVFTEREIAQRIEKIAEKLRRRGLDYAFLHSADNVYYSTGVPLLAEWGRPMWALVGSDGQSWLIGSALESANMRRNSHGAEILSYDDSANVMESAIALLASILGRGNIAVGVEEEIISHRLYLEIDKLDCIERIEDIGGVLSSLRLVKSEEEKELLRLGGQVAKIGADSFIGALRAGVTELEVGAASVAAMDQALGALLPHGISSSYSFCLFGDNILHPHTLPSGRRLQRGDLISLNVLPVISGYCMELERVLVFGEETEEDTRALAAVNESFELGKGMYGDGVRAGDIDDACNRVLEQHGYGDNLMHATGHAHGIMLGAASREEGGELRGYNDTLLQPGMFNSVEPAIYFPGRGGYRHSDVMEVVPGGAVCLTTFPTEFSF